MKVYKPIILLCVAALFATSCKKDVDMTLIQKTVLENSDIRQIEVSDAWPGCSEAPSWRVSNNSFRKKTKTE